MIKIESKKAYYEAMAEMESFLEKGFDKLSAKEEKRLNELTDAVEAWENRKIPMPVQPDMKAILLYIMESKGYNQSQLAAELGVSKGFLSGILNGQKQANLEVLKNLHINFNLDGNLLLDSI
ncbi:helix-turn-helix domain-containing protein [Chitinophaga sp. 22620]|uniref:helix-turn-helix domain-containing protein n=1 Tax=Chitinophaga sp. 22620 TaxID=3453952 RepID=UPI003F85E7BE